MAAGESLSGTSAVTFGGVNAEFTTHSDSEVAALVPAGSVTGAITVTTNGGAAKSAKDFTVE